MNRYQSRIDVAMMTQLSLTEEECRALLAIASYGDKPFLDIFYKHLGKTYLQPYENGLRSLFAVARLMGSELNKIDEVRKILKENVSQTPTKKV